MISITDLRKKLNGAGEIPSDVIQYIHQEKWFHIWVPKIYSGLGLNFVQGLEILKNLASIDGSLGWMVTLCAGANYFSRNIRPEVASELFRNKETCFGGSGIIGGNAELTPKGYLINGVWRFATGAPYLSHFTLNAKITANGKPLLDTEGNECIKSFIIPKDNVTIINDWQSMGMKATGTYSFKASHVLVDEKYSFVYNEFFTHNVLDKIPFRIFADLTLLVNYLGIAHHFIEEAHKICPSINASSFQLYLNNSEKKMYSFAYTIENLLTEGKPILIAPEIHLFGTLIIKELSTRLLDLYFQLGIKASHINEPIHQIFCDFFTATQHANFRSVSENAL